MRVAIDGRRLQDRPFGGVGRNFARLIPHLAGAVEVVVLTDARRPPPDVPGVARWLLPLAVPPHVTETPWIQVAVPLWLRQWNGIFHGTFNQLPLVSPVPSVVTIHDLSFEHHPEDFSPVKRQWFRVQARMAARQARRVLAPSEVVRQELIATYRLPPEKVVRVPNGVDPVFRPWAEDDLVEPLASLGVRRPYVVSLGGAPRRGLPVAVRAWKAARASDLGVALVVVGRERPASTSGVTWVGPVADRTWSALLAGAEAFVYPTRYEGFGMPALEAAACGTPVVCAPLPALKEVLDDAAEWCDGPSEAGIAAGLRRILDDPARRAHLGGAALRRACQAPGWAEAAARTVDAYRQAAG
ncbi:MAG TPA: glycosyltransferase family 1 protein [Acidimicrobiales bacterium]